VPAIHKVCMYPISGSISIRQHVRLSISIVWHWADVKDDLELQCHKLVWEGVGAVESVRAVFGVRDVVGILAVLRVYSIPA
jgi:hypothetical protein